MPEGDTVWRTAHRLDQALAGRRLTVGQLRWPSLATHDLTGMTTLAVVSRGKHILHRLDSGLTLHSHLRMEGQWRIEATAKATPRQLAHHDLRAVLGTEQWMALGRRLGMLDLVATSHEDDLVGHLGPDLLGPDWDLDEAAARVARSGVSIGEALLDQRNLAGLGTLWTSESLFIERIHPWLPAAELPPMALASLITRGQALVDAARHHAIQSSTGVRRLGETAYVHARSGRPCRRCGTTVRVAPIGRAPQERTMFYCPTCQGGLADHDGGAPQRPMGSSRGRAGGAGAGAAGIGGEGVRPRTRRPGPPRGPAARPAR